MNFSIILRPVSIFWQKTGDIPPEANGDSNPNSNIYYNPRITMNSGIEYVPFDDSPTASEWCKIVPGKTYTNGTSFVNFANPIGVRIKWNGSSWVTVPNGNYPRYYTCYPVATPPSITVLSPNGGETLQIGTAHTIRWTPAADSSGTTNFVNIYLANYDPPCTTSVFTDSNGLSYEIPCPDYPYTPAYIIALGAPNTGDRLWQVGQVQNESGVTTNAPGGMYTVRVCVMGTSVCDSSNSYFSIIPPVLSDDQILANLEKAVRDHTYSVFSPAANKDPNFDFNNDGKSDATDQIIVRNLADDYFQSVYDKLSAAVVARYGTTPGSATYIAEFDVNQDNVIGSADLSRIQQALTNIAESNNVVYSPQS